MHVDYNVQAPIKRVFEETKSLNEGEVLKVIASDPGFKKDISSWCEKTGNTLVKTDKDEKKNFVAYIKKGKEGDKEVTCSTVKDGSNFSCI